MKWRKFRCGTATRYSFDFFNAVCNVLTDRNDGLSGYWKFRIYMFVKAVCKRFFSFRMFVKEIQNYLCRINIIFFCFINWLWCFRLTFIFQTSILQVSKYIQRLIFLCHSWQNKCEMQFPPSDKIDVRIILRWTCELIWSLS
jgi:hypothetical protein